MTRLNFKPEQFLPGGVPYLDLSEPLREALEHPLYSDHMSHHRYKMDGKGSWELYYYPILGDGKTQEVYVEPRALMKTNRIFKDGKAGMDLREVPLRYIERIQPNI